MSQDLNKKGLVLQGKIKKTNKSQIYNILMILEQYQSLNKISIDLMGLMDLILLCKAIVNKHNIWV